MEEASMNLRFGIIGYGFMGHEHMTLLSDLMALM